MSTSTSMSISQSEAARLLLPSESLSSEIGDGRNVLELPGNGGLVVERMGGTEGIDKDEGFG